VVITFQEDHAQAGLQVFMSHEPFRQFVTWAGAAREKCEAKREEYGE
jgi:hypothetical protein